MTVELVARVALVYGLVLWAGGLIHLAAAVVPQARMLEDRATVLRMMGGVMKRYNPVAWTALIALTVSATYLAAAQGFKPLHSAALAVLYTAFTLDLFHSFVYGPKAAAGDTEARRTALVLAKIETPLALALLPLMALLL
ncbi:MAG: hypothetical protein NZ570_03910 [Candidatus Caldarchaeum sp.]|nr:hypothetical protein [Candidatus Caldarchaeum sp.]MCS7129633.1 hypothetical protein [Candidatus Caldarchaeum sp.]MDW8359801.1 hypothetical protein [Candidatus Caldarchaeum sp.]